MREPEIHDLVELGASEKVSGDAASHGIAPVTWSLDACCQLCSLMMRNVGVGGKAENVLMSWVMFCQWRWVFYRKPG